jgi:hypothetical protein
MNNIDNLIITPEYVASFLPCENGNTEYLEASVNQITGDVYEFLDLDNLSWFHKKWLLLNRKQTVLSNEIVRAFYLMSGKRLQSSTGGYAEELCKATCKTGVFRALDFSELELEYSIDKKVTETLQKQDLLALFTNGVPTEFLHKGR